MNLVIALLLQANTCVSGVVIPCPVPTPTPLPDISATVNKWKSNMDVKGRAACEAEKGYVNAWQSGGPIDPAMSYYDGEGVFYNIYKILLDPYWLDCAQVTEKAYRGMPPIPSPATTKYPSGYGYGNSFKLPGYWGFSEGWKNDFDSSGDIDSKNAIFLLSENMAYAPDSTPTTSTAGANMMREVSYNIQNMENAELLGHTHRTREDLLVNQALGHLRQMIDGTYRLPMTDNDTPAARGQYYLQPFMIWIDLKGLIKYWQRTHDSRIYPAVKEAILFVESVARIGNSNSFYYQQWAPTLADLKAGVNLGVPNPAPAPDLNLLGAPVYSWLYSQDHDLNWIILGDQVFKGGVDGAYLDGIKQFNQNYIWSPSYLEWRK